MLQVCVHVCRIAHMYFSNSAALQVLEPSTGFYYTHMDCIIHQCAVWTDVLVSLYLRVTTLDRVRDQKRCGLEEQQSQDAR